MDLVTSCQEKLSHFRIKELKDILTQLGLSKQGKKQDLADRILAIISDERVAGMWAKKHAVKKEEVAKLVDDVYRKLQGPGASDLASKAPGVSDATNNTTFKEEVVDTYQIEKVRCPCGSSLQADSMIKCEDQRCHVWQHIGCVIIPEKPMEGVSPVPPPTFYCELCRLGRADPFWVTVGHPLYPVKLAITTTSVPADGTSPVQSVEKTFQLTKTDRDLLSKPEFEIQAWCMLLNDKVSFRMQWPQFAELQINGVPVRAINRPGSQLLGANGRDDGPVITPCTREGSNKICLTGTDARVFCLGVRIVRRRTVQQILNLIPKEADGEKFEDAVARVCRCVGGGAATENADSDSDLEVVSDFIPVSLRCPMSGSRMKIAGRFKPCAHMGCFDLDVFVQMNQRSRKWQCPICLKNYSLENIIIDPYFTRITTKMRNCGEDVTEIEVKPDGSWRVKADNDQKSLGELGQWHLPDGTLCVAVEVESKPKLEALKQVKLEGTSEGLASLKLGLKKNRNGIWEVSKSENLHSLSSGNKLLENFVNNGHNVVSSSGTGSGRDGEDPSINQDGGAHFGYSVTNEADFGSLSPNLDPGNRFTNANPPATVRDADIIILSDSEEETDHIMSSGQVYNNGGEDRVPFSALPHENTEDPALVAAGSSCLGLFNSNDDDFGVPFWSLPSTSQQGVPGFQLFGSDENPTMHHTTMDGFMLTEEATMGPEGLVPDSSLYQSNADVNNGLVDNPLAFGHDDPSLQLFLPTRPPEAAEQVESRDQPTVSKGLHGDDWISLSLGGGGGMNCEPPMDGLNSGQQPQSKDGALESLADTASLLLGMNGSKSSRERCDEGISFPRQKRSVRPRLYLSIDTDTDSEDDV